MSPIRAEMRKLASLALPVAATQVSTMLLGIVDTLMLGRLSVDALAAASLGNVWIFGTLMFAMGVVSGIDPIVAQAHGARQGARAGLALQRGLVIGLALSPFVAALFLCTEEFLLFAGQTPALARDAEIYTRMQIPGIPCFLLYSAMRLYLQGREQMAGALGVILLANLANVLFNWTLIFGHLGLPALGLSGAAIATTLTRGLSALALAGWIGWRGLHRDAWVPWSRSSVDLRGLGAVVTIGIPVAIQRSLEIWAFSGAALLAGWIGPVALASHTIAINMAALAFMVPLGISEGAMTRVGNLVGAGRPADAHRAAWVSIAFGAGVMSVSALAFVTLRFELPRIFTTDAAVIAACGSILPIAAAFQIFDGAQVVGCGVLRGVGRTRPAALFNLLGYWVLGLPVGAWLAFRADFGLAGIWWGLCFGLAVVAVLLMIDVQRQGPGRARAISPPSNPEACPRD